MVQNLERVKISEYFLKLSKHKYPLLDDDISLSELLHSKIKFKSVNQAKSIKFSLYQTIAVLDFFNQQFLPCKYCNLPYSYDTIHNDYVCIFCFIILQQRQAIFYLQFDSDDNISSISAHPSGLTVNSNLFHKILDSDTNDERVQEIIDKKLNSSKFIEKSLDEFFE